MHDNTANTWLQAGRLIVVGSALTKPQPRDIDLVLSIPNTLFENMFMPVRQWAKEGRTGKWSEARYKWSETCVQLSHIMAQRMGIKHTQVDLKIKPISRTY